VARVALEKKHAIILVQREIIMEVKWAQFTKVVFEIIHAMNLQQN